MKKENLKLHTQLICDNSLELDKKTLEVLTLFFKLLINEDIKLRRGNKNA